MKTRGILTFAVALALCLSLAVPVLAVDIPYAVEGGNIYFDASTGTITKCDSTVTAVNIPESIAGYPVTAIATGAFKEKKLLKSVTIPDCVTKIGGDTFLQSGVTDVHLGNGISSISSRMFYKCPLLAAIEIPESVTIISDGAFWGCTNLASITIPDNVTVIGDAFRGCKNMRSVTLGNKVAKISSQAFQDCTSLSQIVIPDSVTYIGIGAFSGCTSLKKLTLGKGISMIDQEAFARCTSLRSVTLSDRMTVIYRAAFSNCISLKSIYIPDTIDSIQPDAFYNCTALADVYYGGDLFRWSSIDAHYGNGALISARIHYNSTGLVVEPELNTDPKAIGVSVEGSLVKWTDAAPFIDANNRTMVPLRAVAEALGLDVAWDGTAREAAFTDGRSILYFPIDSSTARTSDGRTIQMDTAAVIVNNRTYAPIRYLAEYFGYEVSWDSGSRTAIIN